MTDAARRGQLDLVAVWRLGRLSRSLPHLLAVLDELRHLGVGFVSIRNPGLDPTSVSGMLMLSIVGAFASYERELLRERVLAGVRRAQSKGTHCSRPRVTLDVRPALALFDAGHSGRETEPPRCSPCPEPPTADGSPRRLRTSAPSRGNAV